MEITNILWREDAMNNLKDIVALYHRQGKKVAGKIIDEIFKDIEYIMKHPFHGYIESSMIGQEKKVSFYFSSKQIKILYYTEKDTLYIVDFWES